MSMLITIMKYIAIGALLAGMLWRMAPNLRSYFDFVVTAGAVFVLVQAVDLRKYWWVAVFVAIACLFNPILPIGFSFGATVALQIMTASIFAVSLQMLKTSRRLTMASITEANPETESL